jgi:hypothetical protein
VTQKNGSISPFKPYEIIIHMLREKLDDLISKQSSILQVERIRFVYIQSVLVEIAYFESKLNEQKAALIDV